MQTIGRYQLLEKLGQGGMGVVYRARDTLLERIVAVKVISAPIDQNAELRERFFREARAAGKLSHKNIITIHDLGEHEGQPYLAMEYLEGEDLLARMAAPQRMSLRRKVEIATEMCEGLDYAHTHGVVHRDIKPANVFITDGGTVKILDFGLARLVTSELTRSNMMMGTINYMAPEQIRGEKVDHRVDIFSTAVVLYELLSGRRAFDADSFAATLYKILQEVPEPLQQIDPTLPSELIQIVECGLAKARDERYQHMSEMLVDLAVYRQHIAGFDSPGTGHPAPVELRTPSGRPVPLTPSGRPMDVTTLGPQTPVSTPVPPVTGPVSTPPSSGLRTLAIFVVALLALGVAGLAMWKSMRPHATPPDAAAPAPAAAPSIAETMQSAAAAFQAEDYPAAIKYAETVLAVDPGHREARALRDRAQTAAAKVKDGLEKARALVAQRRFEEASRVAGEVLAVDRLNQEAKQIIEDGAERSRAQGIDQARSAASRASAAVSRAKAAARAIGAPRLATGLYDSAAEAERDAQRHFAAGRMEEATIKFYEALGGYVKAEGAAQNEVSAREVAAREAQAREAQAREAQARSSQPADAASRDAGGHQAGSPQGKPADPDAARPSGSGAVPPAPAAPPQRPEQTQVPPPVPPPVAAPPANQPANPAPAPTSTPSPQNTAASREAAVADVVSRYAAAVESRNLEAVRRLWPTMNVEAMRREFQHASRISVEIVDPHIVVANDAATVTFLRRYDMVTVEGEKLHRESRATMDLKRAGTSWLIDRIRFEPIR